MTVVVIRQCCVFANVWIMLTPSLRHIVYQVTYGEYECGLMPREDFIAGK